jgi:site-specific DNA recombinase
MFREEDAMVPRNGHTFVVLIGCRISGCEGQTEVSLEDQEDHGKDEAPIYCDGPTEFITIATKGKGERLDREELVEIERHLRSRRIDLLIVEDLGRLVRGAEAVRLFGIARDKGTRAISPNDRIDTIDPQWEEAALAACQGHVSHNAHTSKRIKHKQMNRFKKFGGAMARPIAGYEVPEDAKTYYDWILLTVFTTIIVEGLRLLRQTLNCSAVADYFNRAGFQRGKYAKRKTWVGSDVREFYQNRLLGGFPGRGFKHTVKIHETGRRVSGPNPKGPTYIECPHLAHVDIAELDEVNTLLDKKNTNCGRKGNDDGDPRLHVPRKQTIFPGQHARCWYCGWNYVWGGNGITENLMCSACRDWQCWNSISFDGELATKKIVELITADLQALDGFQEQFAGMVQLARRNGSGDHARQWQQLQEQFRKLAEEQRNLAQSMVALGTRDWMKPKVTELDAQEAALRAEQASLERAREHQLILPDSPGMLSYKMLAEFERLATTSPEFGELLRLLTPTFFVFTVRRCDGGDPKPRAMVEINLAAQFPNLLQLPGMPELMTKRHVFNVFEPSKPERIRVEAVKLAKEGRYQREIGARLSEPAFQAEVSKALLLQKAMDEQGLDDPYQILLEPPEDYKKLRRYKNAKYCFTPKPGYVPPEIW